MNARHRTIIAWLLMLTFGLALPLAHGEMIMVAATSDAQAIASGHSDHQGHANSGHRGSHECCPAQTTQSHPPSSCNDHHCTCLILGFALPLAEVAASSLVVAPELQPTPPVPPPLTANRQAPWRPPSIRFS